MEGGFRRRPCRRTWQRAKTEGIGVLATLILTSFSVCPFPLHADTDPPESAPRATAPEPDFEKFPAFDVPAGGATAPSSPTTPASRPADSDPGLLPIAFWTGMVLLCFAVATAALRRYWPGARRFFPTESIRILGRRPLTPGHTLYLVDVGQSILRVGCTKEGMTYLGETREPEEVAQIRTLAASGAEHSEGKTFQRTLSGLIRRGEKGEPGGEELPAGKRGELAEASGEPGMGELRDEIEQIRKTVDAWKK